MNINWSPESIGDLIAIRTFISDDDPAAAIRVVTGIVSRIEETLPSSPKIGRPGRVPGTREFVLVGTPFVVPYRVAGSVIQILRVYHGARRWPDAL